MLMTPEGARKINPKVQLPSGYTWDAYSNGNRKYHCNSTAGNQNYRENHNRNCYLDRGKASNGDLTDTVTVADLTGYYVAATLVVSSSNVSRYAGEEKTKPNFIIYYLNQARSLNIEH